MFPECLGKGRPGELAVAERAARERRAIESAVGEITTLEGDIGEKRTGEIAIKELAVGETAARNLKFDEFRFRSMERSKLDAFERPSIGIPENTQGRLIERVSYTRCSQFARR